MHARFEFDFATTATAAEVIDLMTDFSTDRPDRWPALSANEYEVYHVGETEADVREGQDFPKVWAKWHYDWATPNSVTLTVVESDAQAPGSFMRLIATPRPEGGSSVHGVWEQTSTNLAGLIGVATMRFIGPRFCRRTTSASTTGCRAKPAPRL